MSEDRRILDEIVQSVDKIRRFGEDLLKTNLKPVIVDLLSTPADPDTGAPAGIKRLLIQYFTGIKDYHIVRSGEFAHPGTEKALRYLDCKRIDWDCPERDILFSTADAIISHDCAAPTCLVAYDPETKSYRPLTGNPSKDWPDLTSRIMIEEDHHVRRSPLNPAKSIGYDLLLPELGANSTISAIQLRTAVEKYGFPLDKVALRDPVISLLYGMYVDTRGFDPSQMHPVDALAKDWLTKEFMGASAYQMVWEDLIATPVPQDWDDIRSKVRSSKVFSSVKYEGRPVFILDIGITDNYMAIPWTAEQLFCELNHKELPSAVIVFGLHDESVDEHSVQSKRMYFSGRAKNINGELARIFHDDIYKSTIEGGVERKTNHGGGRHIEPGDVDTCGNSIPLDAGEGDPIGYIKNQEGIFIPRIISSFRNFRKFSQRRDIGAFISLAGGSEVYF